MKKIVLIAVAALLSTGAFAQNFDWGVKAGLNLSHLTNSDMEGLSSKMKPSFYVGVFAEFELINDLLGIQPEIQYSRQGNFYKDGGAKAWMRLNYLNVPIVAKLYIIDDLSIDLGPQFGFLLNGKERIKYDGTSVKTKITDNLKKFDISVAMGLTYRIIDEIDVTARYNLGLTKVNKHGGEKSKNGVIQIGAGYRF